MRQAPEIIRGRVDGDLVVTKANNLIEASYRLNINEQRVLALLAAQVCPDDEAFKPYVFCIGEIQKLVDGRSQNFYTRTKELCRGLLKRTLQLRKPDGWLMVNWLSSAEYRAGRGEIELCFDPKLKPYLLELKERFTSYQLRNVIKLRSQYSVRFYELLKQYEPVGKRSFDLDGLRTVLRMGDELKKWNDFKRKALEPAKRELSKKTDICFSYTIRKRGRAVAFVDFEIWPVEQNKPPKKNTAKKTATKSKSPNQQAEQCYRENGYGTKCDVQDLKALNALPKKKLAICSLCANHQTALFEAGAS